MKVERTEELKYQYNKEYPQSDGVRVHESTFLEGQLGVIATKHFRPMDLIFVVRGPIIPKRTDRTLQVGPQQHIDPVENGNPGFGFFINHSCEANAGVRNFNHDGKEGTLEVFALKVIEPGEEVTIDYATTEYETTIDNLECQCGSKQCRKYIKGYKDLPQAIKEKYLSKGLVVGHLLAHVEEQENNL